MKRTLLIALLLCIVWIPMRASAEPETISLAPKFALGRTTRYELWTFRRQDITMSLATRSQASSNRMEVRGEATWTVDSVNGDGSANCTMTLDWMSVRLIANDGAEQTCDSRRSKGDNEKIQRLTQAMTGTPLRVTVGANGAVTAITGVDAIRSRAGADVTVPDDLDFMETASDLAAIPFAPRQSNVGDSFPATFKWTHDMGMMDHVGQFTLAGVEPIAGIPVATVNGHFSLSLTADQSKLGLPKDAPAVDITFNGGKVDTQTMFDLHRGETVGRNNTQTSSVTITMAVSGQTLTRTVNEVVQSQVLRLAEK